MIINNTVNKNYSLNEEGESRRVFHQCEIPPQFEMKILKYDI